MDRLLSKVLAVIISLALLLVLPVSSFADVASGAPELNIERCLLDGETLNIVFHTNMDVSKVKFSAMLDSFELGVGTSKGYEAAGGGTSYLVIADLGGVSDKALAKINTLVRTTTGLVGANDNISIMPLGEELHTNPFTNAKPAIDAQMVLIKSLEGEKTNLYSGIVEAVRLFEASSRVKASRKLIIVSDGGNEAALGATLEEAAKAIEQSEIPVCTIGIMNDKGTNSAELVELGSLARRSVGGVDIVLENGDAALEEACGKLEKLDSSCYMLSYDLTDIAIESILANLVVSASMTGVEVKSDIDVDLRHLINERRANEPTPAPTPEPTPTPVATAFVQITATDETVEPVAGIDKELSKAISDKTLTWAIIDGVAVIGVLILVAIIARRRRQEADSEDEDVSDSPACHMTLIRLTGARFSYKEIFTSSMTVGRSAREAQLVLLDEETVAPTHCRIDLTGNRLSVISLDNGYDTTVNGETVGTRQKLLLRQGDVLQLGELKLKLRWYIR